MYRTPNRVRRKPRWLRKSGSSGNGLPPLSASSARRISPVCGHNGQTRSLRPLPNKRTCGGLEADIEHTHCDDFLNPCACIEHRGEEGVITTAIGRSPVNCGQHSLNLIEFE